jgi:hypothetical protein
MFICCYNQLMLKMIKWLRKMITNTSHINNNTSHINNNTKNTLNTSRNKDTYEIKNYDFLHLFQKELYIIVLKQIHFFPKKICEKSLKEAGRMCYDVARTNKNFYFTLKNTLNDLSRMYFLYSKYSRYNSEYENPQEYYILDDGDLYNFDDPPILIDAMNTNCVLPFAFHSQKTIIFDDEIRDIIRLMPRSIYSNLGRLRCRNYVTPFVAAVFNTNISEDVLTYLIQNGCDPYAKYELNGVGINAVDDIKNNDIYRYNLLVKLLHKLERFEH